MPARLISIIGPPASGKTTLAEYLATELPAEMVREDYRGNPFLTDSYVGPAETRLPGQLYFLLSRARQLSAASLPPSGLAVSDHGFCQDQVFARLRLSEEDFGLYEAVAERILPMVEAPAMLICLDAPVDRLGRRISQRGRDYETAMTGEFLSDMRAEYARLAAETDCPVITIDTDSVDVRQRGYRAGLIAEIREKL